MQMTCINFFLEVKLYFWKITNTNKINGYFILILCLCEVAQSCPILCDPVDCSPPGSSVHGILQARILEWVAISFSRGSSQPRDRTHVSHIAGRCFSLWATRGASSLYQTRGRDIFPSLLLKNIIPLITWNLKDFRRSVSLTFHQSVVDLEIAGR